MKYFTCLKVTLTIWNSIIEFAGSQETYDGEDISSLPTVFESETLPTDGDGNFLNRYMASVGNGHIATAVYSNVVFMNGLLNGFKGESHRAIIPSRNNLRVEVSQEMEKIVSNHSFALDVEKGMFIEKFTIGDFQVEERTFAHRYYHKIIVNQFYIKPLISGPMKELELLLSKKTLNSSVDIVFDLETEFESTVPSKYSCGKAHQAEDLRYQDGPSTICIVVTELPEKLVVSKEITYTYFASYDRTMQGASGDYTAVTSLVTSGNHEEIYLTHIEAWKQVWNEGRIEVEGNLQLSKVIYGCLYYILSSLPIVSDTFSAVGQFYGLSPGGLAYGSQYLDFQGHSFWDTEIWMYPIVVYFYPEAAREILNYRLFIVKAARDRAKETGYKGVRFPWEGGVTGTDVTPDCCPEVKNHQVHITGDVAFAIRQYIGLTRDFEWLKQTQPNYLTNGYGLLKEIAEFWVSRVTFNKTTGRHDINDVMPPDSDHPMVNNNGFTNVVAGYAIFYAKYAECLCNGSMGVIPEEWVNIAKSLTFLHDESGNYHPEFEGYTTQDLIKQADAVLLGFPLMYEMDSETRKNDLNIYEKVTRQNGPAMTWAMHTIGVLEFDEVERAEAIFNRSYQSYMRQPFKIWTDNQPPTLGTVNFITGMGGFLQAVVSGYGGYRLYPDKIIFNKPRVLPNSKSLKFVGLNFLDNVFDVLIEQTFIKVTLKESSSKYFLVIESGNMSQGFVSGKTDITLKNTDEPPISFTIKTLLESSCPVPFDKINLPYDYKSFGSCNRINLKIIILLLTLTIIVSLLLYDIFLIT